jgi:hypothetical protein
VSVVSGIVLMTSLSDDDSDAIAAVHKWIADRGQPGDDVAIRMFGPLLRLDDAFGGSKHPQLACWGAGYSYFPDEAFVAFVVAQKWEIPEEVVLVVYFEHDPPKVYRPGVANEG